MANLLRDSTSIKEGKGLVEKIFDKGQSTKKFKQSKADKINDDRRKFHLKKTTSTYTLISDVTTDTEANSQIFILSHASAHGTSTCTHFRCTLQKQKLRQAVTGKKQTRLHKKSKKVG